MQARLAMLLLAAALFGCAKDQQPPTTPGTGSVTLRLTDAPASYDEVNLVITGVQVMRGANELSGAWETLITDTTTVDLLQLRNGLSTNLAVKALPAGHYSRLRLMIGQRSTVMADGASHPLEVPGAAASGVLTTSEFDVNAGGQVDLLLDFDAARSVHLTGNGTYVLVPVFRVLVNPAQSTGSIAGRVLPEGPQSFLFAIQGADTLTAAIPILDGHFTLTSLAAGVYDVAVDVDSRYRDTTITDVAVVVGEITRIGNVHLTPE